MLNSVNKYSNSFVVRKKISARNKNKYKQMCENKIKSFNENSKLFLYKKLKLNLEREFYLSYNNPDIRRGFTKISIRDLEIEKGRYCKIPRILRLCENL